MGLATVFKLSVYVLTGFVGLALGLAEYGPIPFISLPITVFAYWWCETGTKSDGSHRGVSDTAAIGWGIAALGAATIEFFSESQEGKLLAGIHLVVYLTWIVLLQKKTIYRYWLLMALGIMHIAVGSVLTNSTWYGLCMVVYLFGSIWTLSVFSLYRVAQEFSESTAHHQVVAAKTVLRGYAFNSIRFEDDAHWISMRLVSGTLFTSFAGLFVGIVFFALIPRVWVGSALGISDDSLPAAMRGRITGQATEIRLGDIGPILESNDPVLTMRLFDNQTNRPMNALAYAESIGMREPLFRGAVMTEYVSGRWRPERATHTTPLLPPAPDPAMGRLTVRQEIHLDRSGAEMLLCLGQPVAMRNPDDYRCGRFQISNNLIVRRDMFKTLPGAFEYIAYTPLPGPHYEPGMIASPSEMVVYRIGQYLKRCTEVSESLDRLKAFTRQLVEEAEQKAGNKFTDEQKAQFIEAYLRNSGQFTYSLDAQPVDADSDPVEDFVFRRRAGHCQYFASALALMLRSVGIPTRLAAGFKGGEELPGGELSVEKRFAHVWVEAWIENRKWVTYDATPEDARAEGVTAVGSKRNFFTSITSKLAGIWESNVLDISYERQDDMIYEPLRQFLRSIVQFARDFWNSPRASVIGILAFMADPRNWLTIPGGLTLAGLAGLLILMRRKSSWIQFRWRKKALQTEDSQRSRIEFYERFVRLMKRQGRQRGLSQTQGEFVDESADALSTQLEDTSLPERLKSISDSFYVIRFGDSELTDFEKQRLDELLTRLEQTMESATQPA
ncbi:MAG: transglutaminase domain protein [Schlesneria sp.]|nr:transglutaminase domain protein [Schlesneria sp.]